jgi:hypothetical protein
MVNLKYIQCVTHNPNKISYAANHCMHAPMRHIQNAPPFFAKAVCYGHEMLMKLTPVVNLIKNLHA